MDFLLYIFIGLILGIALGWFISKAKMNSSNRSEKEKILNRSNEIEKDFVAYKAATTTQIQTLTDKVIARQKEIESLTKEVREKDENLMAFNVRLSNITANLEAAKQTISEKNADILALKEELNSKTKELNDNTNALFSVKANNRALNEKLETQKKEMEELSQKFNTQFENIANKILETKTQKFTELNKNNLKSILDPLGKNIDEFKKAVNETYNKGSKERFSLEKEVKELAKLNQVITNETRNLTKALKGEAKTQGRWGEMILESILEKSGLRKGEEYFLEYQLKDEFGNALRSDAENKKMRPDAVIKYPDKRFIIIDSKVSLNAFTRYLDSDDKETQKKELQDHVQAVKNHILALSTKGYDDFGKTLDFVMMFIPSEPAYMAAMQSDPDLWNYAYDKRIVLINPTNLIISLKLISDLWKREYQNKNAQDIAERGAKLYDKFVGFVQNLELVGNYLDKSKEAYNTSYKQLKDGRDNLISQATKLKNLGIKHKKELPQELVDTVEANEIAN